MAGFSVAPSLLVVTNPQSTQKRYDCIIYMCGGGDGMTCGRRAPGGAFGGVSTGMSRIR